ncbi:MAG: SafA/ExsA family spore coat assembly protein [Firmicutes bacterium]|nr:SafA/ExsA family spore coat assembly protein [Bacillota bacterium]
MKPKEFISHKHVAEPRGVKGGRVPAGCPHGFQGRYTVQPGDTMYFIAKRYGVSLDALIAANPQIANPNLIFPGDVLCVPGPPVPKPPHKGRVPKRCPHGFQDRYKVRPGDSMFSIAREFHVSLDALIAANPHITDPALIFPGDVLCVPGYRKPGKKEKPHEDYGSYGDYGEHDDYEDYGEYEEVSPVTVEDYGEHEDDAAEDWEEEQGDDNPTD